MQSLATTSAPAFKLGAALIIKMVDFEWSFAEYF